MNAICLKKHSRKRRAILNRIKRMKKRLNSKGNMKNMRDLRDIYEVGVNLIDETRGRTFSGKKEKKELKDTFGELSSLDHMLTFLSLE